MIYFTGYIFMFYKKFAFNYQIGVTIFEYVEIDYFTFEGIQLSNSSRTLQFLSISNQRTENVKLSYF